MRLTKILLIGLAFLSYSVAYGQCNTPLSGTYTIDQNTATGGTNFQTFNDFADEINCIGVSGPVTVNVAPLSGPYNEQVVFEEIAGASSTNTITINGNGNKLTYLAMKWGSGPNTDTLEYKAVLTLDGTDYMTISDLEINAEGENNLHTGWVVLLTNEANHNTIQGCFLTFDSTYALSGYNEVEHNVLVLSGKRNPKDARGVNPGNYNTFINNEIVGGYHAVAFTGVPTDLSVGNTFTNNIVRDFQWYGITVRNQDSLIVEGNDVHRKDRPAFSCVSCSPSGFHAMSNITNAIVRNNRIHDLFTGFAAVATGTPQCIFIEGAQGDTSNPNYVYNNMTYRNGKLSGGQRAIILQNGGSDWHFYHNTVLIDDEVGANSTGNVIMFFVNNASNFSFKNNILYSNLANQTFAFAVYLLSESGKIDISHNGYNIPSGANLANIGGGNVYATVNDWRNQTPYGTGSVQSNPGFDSLYRPAANDYIGGGTPDLLSIVPADILNDVRNDPPDLGAINHSQLGCLGVFNESADSVYPTGAFLSWEAVEEDFNIEWGPVGYVQGTIIGDTGTFVSGLTDSIHLTGLIPDSCYDVYVQEVCFAGPGAWYGPITFCTPIDHDAEILNVVSPEDGICGTDSLEISVEIRNNGFFPITSLPITLELTGTNPQTINFTYTGNLLSNETEIVNLGTFDAESGGIYTFEVSLDLLDDANPDNDSLTLDRTIIPLTPIMQSENLICPGDSSIVVTALDIDGLTYGWYDAETGGNYLGDSSSIEVDAQNPNVWLQYNTFATSRSFNYEGEDIPSDFSFREKDDTSQCPGTIIAQIPPGAEVTGVDVSYAIFALAGFTSSQRSMLRCVSTGVSEDSVYPGSGNNRNATLNYIRNGLDIANGVTATGMLEFELHVGRVQFTAGPDCDPIYNKALANSYSITVHYIGDACDTSRTEVVINTRQPLQADFTYTINPGREVDFENTSIEADSIEWDFAGLGTSNEDNPSFTFADADTFQVCLYAFNECEVDTICMDIEVGISVDKHDLAQSMRIYPNPNQGQFSLELPVESIEMLYVELMDLQGRVIWTETENTRNMNTYNKELNFGHLASGVYHLRVRAENATVVKKIIIQ